MTAPGKPNLIAAAGTVQVATASGRPGERTRRAVPIRWLLRIPVLGLLGLFAGFVWFLMHTAPNSAEAERHTDGIAVLTGGAERVETGLRLLKAGQADQLLISGVHRDVHLADLVSRADLASAALAGRVEIGHAAVSTRGNAAEIAAWARAGGLRSLRIVTAGYHMPRALLEVRRALPDVQLVANPVVPARLREPGAASAGRTWSLLAGEYLKFLAASFGLSPATPAGKAS